MFQYCNIHVVVCVICAVDKDVMVMCLFIYSPSRIALKRAQLLLSIKHGIARLDNVWGVGGGQRPVMFLISKVEIFHRLSAVWVKLF